MNRFFILITTAAPACFACATTARPFAIGMCTFRKLFGTAFAQLHISIIQVAALVGLYSGTTVQSHHCKEQNIYPYGFRFMHLPVYFSIGVSYGLCQ